ncbi:MAG: lamin tail domain-containing protein, partial [Flavobacteriales bacterium]|nr:lamin tail domain-containing protein [Flavobacteriales bacterium]
MKKILTLLFACITLFVNAQSGLLNGTGYAPDITVNDINGNTHNLYSYLGNGKIVVLELMSTTCGFCQQYTAGNENAYQTYGPSGADVAEFLALEVNASTTDSDLTIFANTYGVNFPICNDISPTGIDYQMYYQPSFYVIYPDSSYTTICPSFCNENSSSTTIEILLNSAIQSGLPPAYGCTDPLASNFDSTATAEDGSCDYTSYFVTTVGMAFSPDTIFCDVGDTINFSLGGYHNAVEVDQATFLASGNVSNGGFNFGYGATGMFIPTNPQTYYYVCQPHASGGMVGVIIASSVPIAGCTDSTATNYDSNATVDDGSCFYGNLFISEYAEGSGYNKYIEIYNGTSATINLANYELWTITNGGNWTENTLSLSGSLAVGGVYVIHHSSSNINSTISAVGDINWSQAVWTGDDAVGLAYNGNLIDVIGEDGPDPGNGWNVAGITDGTKDHTLVRKCSVTQGNTDWNLSSGTDSMSSEWVVLSQNDWTDIGQHTTPCLSVDVYGCTDSLAINFDSLATIDDGSCTALALGCTDTTAFNFDAIANIDDGTCCYISGCTDILATNYDVTACYDDGTCIAVILGCSDNTAMNYDSIANTSDGSCIYLNDKVALFFSEYGEGNSNNKYLEIYNATANAVDLSAYALARVSNAPTTLGVYEYWLAFDSGAVILANDVYIIAHPSADSIILAQADMTYSTLSNGDDGFALVYGVKPIIPVAAGNEYVILDVLGDFNGVAGNGWDVAGISEATKNHVLVRKCVVDLGNTDWTISSGVDSISSEWLVLSNENWTDIGVHTYPCSIIIVNGCTDSIACNYDSLANTDDGTCNTAYGCTDVTAQNYNSLATCDDGSCLATVYGCTNPLAINYYPGANVDDGSCCLVVGCTDSTASNYNASACYDDGTCTFVVSGCTDPLATNYNALATVDDGSCTYPTNCNAYPTGLNVYD